MESLAILLIILIFLLMVSYILCDRDMMTPDVLYIAGFVLAVIAASMNVSAWGIDLSSKTIMIILIGALSFIIGHSLCMCVVCFQKSKIEIEIGMLNEK